MASENISETRNVASTSKRGDPKLEGISQKVPPVFMQSQQTVANHRKNAVNLHKIQTQAAAINEEVPGRGIKLTGEKAFNDVFMDMVNRVLPLKKGIVQADKVVKFVGTFVKYTTDKGTLDHAYGDRFVTYKLYSRRY